MGVLSSMNAYFLWFIPSVFISLACVICFFFINLLGHKPNYKIYYFWSIIPLLLLAILKLNIIYILSQVILFVIILQILSLPLKYKQNILIYCGKALSFILAISLAAWIINLFIFELPVFGMINYRNEYFFENHILFLRLTNITGYFRFASIFLEPGHLSMFCSFFLFAFHYNFRKWYNWVLVLSILFSLSLAGYILLVIGFFLNLISQKKAILGKTIIILLFLAGGYGVIYYNLGEENIVYEKIFMRLQYDEDEGIAGNNRTDMYTDSNYQKFLKSSNCWLGYSLDEYNNKEESEFIHGAGYKMYIFRNGILGVIACLFFYSFLAYKSENRRYMLLFVVLFSIAFLQRSYPFWIAWILPFLCVQIPKLNSEKKRKKNESTLYIK